VLFGQINSTVAQHHFKLASGSYLDWKILARQISPLHSVAGRLHLVSHDEPAIEGPNQQSTAVASSPSSVKNSVANSVAKRRKEKTP
jgi:hypothetical protein